MKRRTEKAIKAIEFDANAVISYLELVDMELHRSIPEFIERGEIPELTRMDVNRLRDLYDGLYDIRTILYEIKRETRKIES